MIILFTPGAKYKLILFIHKGACTAVMLICLVQQTSSPIHLLHSHTDCKHMMKLSHLRSLYLNGREGLFYLSHTSLLSYRWMSGVAGLDLFCSRNSLLNSNLTWSYIPMMSLDPCKLIFQQQVRRRFRVNWHSTKFIHEGQFTCRREYYSACKDSCVKSSVAMEGAIESLRK